MAEDLKKLVEKGISRGYSLEKIQSDFANAGWGEAYLNNIPVYYNELKKKSPVGPKGAGVLPSRQVDTRFSSESQLQQDKYAGVGNVPLSDPLLKKKDGLADSLFKIINQAEKDADNANKYVPQIQKLWNDYSSIERGQKETQNIFDERGRINRLALSSLNASAKRNSDRVKEEAKAIAKDDGVLETAARGFYGGILGAADYVANLFDPDTYDDQPDAPDSLGLEAKRQLERAQKASLGRKLSAGYAEEQIEDGFFGNFAKGNYGAAFDLYGRDLIEVLPQSAVGFIPYVGLPLMAASAGGGGWQAVKDDDKYSTLEKFLYAPLVGAAEYATEKFFGMDRRMVQKGLSEAFGKTIKSGADIPKKELGDMLFGGIPKAVRAPLEEGLEEGIVSTFTQTLDKIMAGKPFDPVEIAESVMLGAGAGGSTYALVRGGSALLQTPVFNDVYTITNNVNKINELLKSDDIVPEEKEILSNRLNQFKTQLNQLRSEASDYYKPFSQEDKQRTLELNQAITKGMKTYGAMKTPEAKAEVVNTIRQSLAEKAQIEQKYDSTQKQQVPSPVVQGAQPGGVPIQGTSAEAPKAGGVLQVPSQQEEEIASKTKVIENSSPAFSFKPVSVTLTENNAPEVIGNITTYVDTIPDELFKTLSTSRQEVMNGVESISNVISSLSKSGRQVPVTVYATEDAWKRGTGQPLSRGIYVESEVEGQPSSISVFLPALVGNTVYHEGLHDVVPKVFGTKGIETVAKRLSQAVKQDPLLAAQLGQFVSNYEQSDKAEEFLAELGSRVSAGDIDIEVTKSLATRFMEAVASVLGAVGIKMSPNASQLSRAFLEYAQKLGAGVELGEIENMLEGNTEPGPVANTQKIKKPTKYQDIIETKDSYNLSYVNPTNVVNIEKLIDEIVSEGKTVLFWAGDQIGVGQYTDPFTKKKYDLQGGPSYMLNPTNVKRGAVWASNIEPNTFNDILLNKKPDYVFIVSGEETSMMFFNKTVGNIWIDRAKSKFNDISSFKEAFGKVTKGVEYKTISGYDSWDELRNQLEKKVNTKADTTDVNIAKSLIKAIASMNTASSVDFLKSYGLTIGQFNDLRDGYFKENNFGMLDITTIYKPKELIKGGSNHLTYRNVLMGELVGVPDRKMSSKDIMTDEFMLGTTGKGFVRKDLPDVQLIKAIAPDTPGVRAVARPRKVMRMALEGYNEKPQAMAGQRLFNEPLKEAAAIADKYYEKEFNEARPKFNGVKSVDKERAKKISDAYIKMEDNYFDPEVKKAYDAMVEETLKQFDFIVDRGYKVVINNKEPYKNSEDMITDLRDNKVMRIFSTESGFGDNPITENQRDSNPLLKDSGREDANGIPLLNNDLFRFVHDFFGHAELGNGFGAVGEENAWNVHARMYSPIARRAMTSETRGQNSYVNFSGVNEDVFKIRDKAREERKKGNDAEADRLLDEVQKKMKFADQKVGLLPEEMAIPDGFEDTKPKPKAKRMAIVPSESREIPSQIDARAGELLLDLFKGTKYFDRVKSIKRQLIIDPESRKKYEKALGEKDGRALYGILGNQDSEKAIAFAKEKFPIKGSLAAMADRVYLPTNSEEVLNFGSTVIYSEYQKYLNKELKDIVNESTLDPKDLLREVGYELFNPKNLTEARESFLHFYENGKNICTLNIGSNRFQESFVTFIVKDDAAITPMADKLTQDNLTKDWKDYLEKKGRKNADGTYNLKGIGRDSLDPYSTSVVSLQINKSNGVVKEISRYNHQIGSPDNIFSRDFNKIIDGLEDAMFKKFGVNKNINQSRKKIPYGIIQDADGRFFNYISEKNGVYYGDGFYLEGGVATLLDKNSQRMVDGFVINANGKVQDVINSGKPFFYGDVLKVNYIKGNEISLKTVNGDFVFEVTNGAVSNLINFPKAWVEKELDKISSYTYDSEGGIIITYTRFSDDFLERINMLWSDDIVGFNTSMDFSNTKIQSLGKLKYITGNANFSRSNIQSLGELMYIGGNAWFSKSKVQSLGELRYVGSMATFLESQIQSLGKLRYVGSDIEFAGSIVKSLGELRFVAGYASFFEAQVQSLGKLRYVGSAIDTYDVQSLGELRYVGTTASFPQIQDKSFEELRYVGGYIHLGNLNRIESIGNLSHVGRKTLYSSALNNIQEEINNLVDSRKSIGYGLIGKEEYARVRAEYHQISKKTEELVRGLNQGFESNSSSTIEKAILEIDEIGDAKPKVKRQEAPTKKAMLQIIGENAELAQDVRDNLRVARNMEMANEDAKTIRMATGWERGKDNKWRYEVKDLEFKKKIGRFEEDLNQVIRSAKNGNVEQYDLEQLIDSNLFDFYPSLKNTSVILSKRVVVGFQNILGGVDASYYKEGKRGIIAIKAKEDLTIEKLRLILVHEIQHAIQDIEGFAEGNYGVSMQEEIAAEKEINLLDNKIGVSTQILRDGNDSFLSENINELSDIEKAAYEDILDYSKSASMPILDAAKVKDRIWKKDKATQQDILKQNERYVKTAGEVEARNVETRIKLTPEQRRAITLQETEDVARDEQITLFDTKPEVKLQKIAKAQGSQLEAQMYAYLLSISQKQPDNTYKLPFTLDDFLSYMVPTFSKQRATEIYENVSKGVTPEKVVKSVPSIDDAYDASKKLLDSQKNKKIFTWDAARKFFLDRQATLKAAILKAGMKNAYNLLVNRAGSGARANYFFSKQEKAIYDGLSSKDIEALDKIIMLRRIAEIDKNFDVRGEKRPIHPNKLNFESAQIGLAEKRKELGDAKFNELNDRANQYFDAFKSLLDSMYDEGLINEDLYNRLKNLDYQPRMFIEHVFDMDELSMRDINLSANQVKRIKDGSEDEIMFDSRFLLAVYSKSTFSRIARNKVNRAIAEATSVNGNEEWISKDPKKQFSEVTYFEDGVRKQFYIKSSLKGELDDVQRFGAIPPESQKYVGLLSGSYLLKLLATRANPLFVFRNIPRDYLHVLFFTNVYDNMNMPLAMYRLAGDAIKGVKGKIKDDQDYKDFIEYGGGMEYLSTEGKEGMMTNRSLLNRTIEKLGSAGELSEIAFRLGMYKRLVQESLKNFDGTPTEEQLAQIKVEAVTKSREMIDFAQGGVATKTLESAVPYINAAFQGFRVSSAYIKNNPKEFVIKLGQLAIGLAVIAMYNAVMGDDDMEDIPEDVKRKYFIIMTPFTEEKDGKTVRKYIKIAKTQQLIPFISSLDMSLEGNLIAPFMGREPRFNEDTIKQSWDAFLSYFPKDPTKPLDEALSSVPLFSALAAYKMNYDTYRKRIVSTDYQDKNVLPAYEDFSDKNVPYFYKAIGQTVVGGAGPKRLQVATEKFITTPYSSLITMGGYTLMDAIASNVYEVKGPGGYTPAEQEAISNKALKSAGINAEKIFIGTTDPDHKIYNKREQIERINLEASTERRGLKLQAKELGGKYFTAKEQGDAKGMNEALEAIKNARIEVRNKAVEEKNKQDYDYFNDALKTNMRFGPTFPQEYNDITFATDNEARAKIIAIRDMNMTQKELIDYLVDYKRKTGKSIDIRTIIREYDKFVTNEKK